MCCSGSCTAHITGWQQPAASKPTANTECPGPLKRICHHIAQCASESGARWKHGSLKERWPVRAAINCFILQSQSQSHLAVVWWSLEAGCWISTPRDGIMPAVILSSMKSTKQRCRESPSNGGPTPTLNSGHHGRFTEHLCISADAHRQGWMMEKRGILEYLRSVSNARQRPA